ncbi:MAG: iron-containing alcohol dehydrogenase, partial [Atopobiaceae bacterium]|nr:iron-containing alcohol dehydrogenase [Atopobiaceae bacterium]
MSLEKYSLKLPKAVYSGKGALGEIGQVLKTVGATKVAAFTDKGLRKLGLFDLVEKELKASGVPYEIFDNLPAEPSYT